ncbi:MAG: zf-HC2 domain-containing protein [Candidatus Omnitrophota bacterium]
MKDNVFNKIIGTIYQVWEKNHERDVLHPDEEAIAAFLEGKSPSEERMRIKSHLARCQECAAYIEMHLKVKPDENLIVPVEIMRQAKEMPLAQQSTGFLELILVLKEKILELISTTGDVLVGQEFIPSPVLRSRSIKDFEGKVIVLKDFKEIRVEIRVENEQGSASTVTVIAKNKLTQEIVRNLRITLLKEGIEFESYLADSGQATFQHIELGKYTIEISGVEEKMASVILEIKK